MWSEPQNCTGFVSYLKHLAPLIQATLILELTLTPIMTHRVCLQPTASLHPQQPTEQQLLAGLIKLMELGSIKNLNISM